MNVFIALKESHFWFLFIIPASDIRESMFGHQNVSPPAAGIKSDNLAPEASSMCANH